MQPSVSPTLPQSLDVTPSLFRDLGWFALLWGPAATYVLPSSAHAQGRNGAFYATYLVIANCGTADASITIRFLGHDRDGFYRAEGHVGTGGRTFRRTRTCSEDSSD